MAKQIQAENIGGPCINNKSEMAFSRGLKLLEHAMKAFERILEGLIRKQVSIDDMQFDCLALCLAVETLMQ